MGGVFGTVLWCRKPRSDTVQKQGGIIPPRKPFPKSENMRKIDKEMLAAIDKKVAWKSGRTEVQIDGETIVVRLNGHMIAEKYCGKWMAHNMRWRQEKDREIAWVLTALGFVYFKAEKSWWHRTVL